MKCSRCGQPLRPEEATHEVIVTGGKPVDVYLCESCAREAAAAIQQHAVVKQVVVAAIQTGPAGRAAEAGGARPVCPHCRTTFNQFKHDGVLGCPMCYEAFEPALGPLIERAHEGGTHHVGKVPRRSAALRAAAAAGELGRVEAAPARGASILSPQERLQRSLALNKQLQEAVAAEQYERAAKLRDEIRRLEGLSEPSGGGGSGPAPRTGGGS
jgi:protein arginine kinase activator